MKRAREDSDLSSSGEEEELEGMLEPGLAPMENASFGVGAVPVSRRVALQQEIMVLIAKHPSLKIDKEKSKLLKELESMTEEELLIVLSNLELQLKTIDETVYGPVLAEVLGKLTEGILGLPGFAEDVREDKEIQRLLAPLASYVVPVGTNFWTVIFRLGLYARSAFLRKREENYEAQAQARQEP